MNKSELIEAIAKKADMSKTQAAAALDNFLETITEQLTAGNDITLVGFGTFTTKKREARTGRNPQSGQPIEIEAATLPTFKPGKTLKEAVNG